MRMLIATVESGRFDPLPLITHRFALDDIVEAYALFSNRREGVLKAAACPVGSEPWRFGTEGFSSLRAALDPAQTQRTACELMTIAESETAKHQPKTGLTGC
jgi:hypothetical protein